jgi:hypothetical protein
MVDANGNWSAPIGPVDESDTEEGPWVEFWQVQALATFERQAFTDRITPSGTISESNARQFAHLLCSEPRIIPHSGVFSGSWRRFEPKSNPRAATYQIPPLLLVLRAPTRPRVKTRFYKGLPRFAGVGRVSNRDLSRKSGTGARGEPPLAKKLLSNEKSAAYALRSARQPMGGQRG